MTGGEAQESKIRTIVVEDEGLFRDLLRFSLEHSQRIQVVGDFPDGESALAEAPSLAPDVAILDINLGGGMNGITLGRLLRRRLPQLGVVLLSHYVDLAFLSAVPEAEIAGWSYLLKSSVGDMPSLVRAIEGAAAGFVVLDRKLASLTASRPGGLLARLTPRQKEILALVAQGFSNPSIAKTLGLSLKTVENQLNLIYQDSDIDRDDASMQPRVRAVLAYLRETVPAF